ncbi:MAG: metallophosphoesterase [Epsilonproteobacteria bacterium]|nr:MAG: metallophosphoesterase [Campylobacterota bacterium]
MIVGMIGDIVGRPGRVMIKTFLKDIKTKHNIDIVIANSENISHGFGMTEKNLKEMQKAGIDVFTGGNHSFDKKDDYKVVLSNSSVLRPANYPDEVDGKGVGIYTFADEKFAVINMMGQFTMPICDNPFRKAIQIVDELTKKNIKHIIMDFHAETTAEKRVMIKLFENKVSAIFGTHTHIGTDDYEINDGTFYVSDIGLTGCRDNIIGMHSKVPTQKFLTGIGGHFEVDNNCDKIMQIVIIDINDEGKTTKAKKLKIYNNKETVQTTI